MSAKTLPMPTPRSSRIPDILLRCANCGRRFKNFWASIPSTPLCKECDYQSHGYHGEGVPTCTACVSNRWLAKVRAIRPFIYKLVSGSPLT